MRRDLLVTATARRPEFVEGLDSIQASTVPAEWSSRALHEVRRAVTLIAGDGIEIGRGPVRFVMDPATAERLNLSTADASAHRLEIDAATPMWPGSVDVTSIWSPTSSASTPRPSSSSPPRMVTSQSSPTPFPAAPWRPSSGDCVQSRRPDPLAAEPVKRAPSWGASTRHVGGDPGDSGGFLVQLRTAIASLDCWSSRPANPTA